jgi:hypothetical protein
MAETVGSLVDKISIVELKVFNMQKQIERSDATEEHRQACGKRLEILKEQSRDLQNELSDLFSLVLAGKKHMKVYRQFKMYNDPAYRSKS